LLGAVLRCRHIAQALLRGSVSFYLGYGLRLRFATAPLVLETLSQCRQRAVQTFIILAGKTTRADEFWKVSKGGHRIQPLAQAEA
jgi:hypothetical protein